MSKLLRVASLVAVVVAVVAAGSALAARQSSYSPSLSVNWPAGAASVNPSSTTSYVVGGCGYNSSFGGVTVVVHSPAATSFAGQMPDSSGCISLSNFATQGAGHYEIDAYQTMHGKSALVASTSFDL